MKRVTAALLFITSIFVFIPVLACDEQVSCDKIDTASEYSWNPCSEQTPVKLKRFYALDNEIKRAYAEESYVNAKELIHEYLALAEVYRCNWNYGNAIHDANRILGLISLHNDNLEDAANYLIKAGKSTGSPQLDTFGPELDLANALLNLGETEAVKAYLRDIQSFWEMDEGRVDEWLTAIDAGETPELSRFSFKMSIWEKMLYWLYLLWPIVIVGIFLFLLRKKLRRILLFCVLSILAGYIAMYVFGWGITAIWQSVMLALIERGYDDATLILIYVILPLEFLVPVVTTYLISRLFRINRDNNPDSSLSQPAIPLEDN